MKRLCEAHHGYGSAGNVAAYAFAVKEGWNTVAAYAWQPPAPGAAVNICPEEPASVLALSRMVAVPKADRKLKHVSKPLMVQMKRLIDRTRWPVLVTYSDESLGHTGYVYQCSGWTPTERNEVRIFVDDDGRRVSRYSNGQTYYEHLHDAGTAVIQRWEHWACEKGEAAEYMKRHGWRREPIPGKTWRSGNQAFRLVKNPIDAIVGTG